MKCAKKKCRGKVDTDHRLGVWVEGVLIVTHPCGTCKRLHSQNGEQFFNKREQAGFFKQGLIVFKGFIKPVSPGKAKGEK